MALAIVNASLIGAQQPSAPKFEVASIKLHQDLARTVGIAISGTRVTVSAMSVSNLVGYAYDLKSYQVSGGPNWAASDRWDIDARGEGDSALTRDLVRKMIEALLADRFHLQLRRENRQVPVYALVVAGKAGPKLKASAPDAASVLTMGGNRTIQIKTTKGNIEQLVGQLSTNLDRPVLDKTGLTGSYDYQLEWAPSNAAAADLDAPSIFTAVQEQLGLKLESATAPIEILVIDRVEKPSEN
ncbi:MAG TPA: TIGR03435 family protein [Bryobacteraceae bacterium]